MVPAATSLLWFADTVIVLAAKPRTTWSTRSPVASWSNLRRRGSRGRSAPGHQDLGEGSALEAFFFDDVEFQMRSQVGEWAAPRADRDRDRRQLVLVDKAEAGQR